MIALLLALAYPALSDEANRALATAPREIGVFLERRAECEHWAGEEAYDKARFKEISRAVRDLGCTRIALDEAALKRKYAKQPKLLALFDYD